MKNNTPKRIRLIYGVGINDANYAISPVVNGKQLPCPFYACWINILRRCYCEKHQKIKPYYIGCKVADEWLYFSNFKSWMEMQDWKGKSIDKDLLIQYNKVYSSTTCIFVSAAINNIVTNSARSRGKYPIGVDFNESNGKYRAQCQAYGKKKGLGYYCTPEEAYEAYKKFKYKHIAEIAAQQSEPLKTALLNYVIEG
jgi:hypothetical protein